MHYHTCNVITEMMLADSVFCAILPFCHHALLGLPDPSKAALGKPYSFVNHILPTKEGPEDAERWHHTLLLQGKASLGRTESYLRPWV